MNDDARANYRGSSMTPEDLEIIEHTHTEETWDEYRTKHGSIAAVEYKAGKLHAIHFRFGPDIEHSDWGTLQMGDLETAQQLLTAMHAALAGIAKKEIDKNGTN